MRKSINTEVSNHCTLALHISNIYKTLGLDLPAQCLWKRQSQPQHMIYHCIQYEQEMVLCHKDQPFNGQRPLKRPKSKKSFLVWAAGQRWQKLAGCGSFKGRVRPSAGRPWQVQQHWPAANFCHCCPDTTGTGLSPSLPISPCYLQQGHMNRDEYKYCN